MCGLHLLEMRGRNPSKGKVNFVSILHNKSTLLDAPYSNAARFERLHASVRKPASTRNGCLSPPIWVVSRLRSLFLVKQHAIRCPIELPDGATLFFSAEVTLWVYRSCLMLSTPRQYYSLASCRGLLPVAISLSAPEAQQSSYKRYAGLLYMTVVRRSPSTKLLKPRAHFLQLATGPSSCTTRLREQGRRVCAYCGRLE